MEGPIGRLAKMYPPREGYVQRLCVCNDARLEELVVQGYKPVLRCEPVIVDVGGGQKAALMEIEKWAYDLRTTGNVGLEVEREIEARVGCRLLERLDKVSFWEHLRYAFIKLWPWRKQYTPLLPATKNDPFESYRHSL